MSGDDAGVGDELIIDITADGDVPAEHPTKTLVFVSTFDTSSRTSGGNVRQNVLGVFVPKRRSASACMAAEIAIEAIPSLPTAHLAVPLKRAPQEQGPSN